MKHSFALLAAISLALAACASDTQTRSSMAKPRPDPLNPQVFVVGGKRIVVDQEPLLLRDRNVPVVWHLPEDPSPYRFPAHGIVIEQKGHDQFVRCGPSDGGLKFSCFAINNRRDKFKYTINVTDGNQPLEPLDPYIVND